MSKRKQLPDPIRDALINQLRNAGGPRTWQSLLEAAMEEIRATRKISEGTEMFRLKAYEKLHELVRQGSVDRQQKLYTLVPEKSTKVKIDNYREPTKKEDLHDIALRVLNEAYEADPVAIQAIMRMRIPCNHALALHPTIQVGDEWMGSFDVGVLGLLNGIIEAATGKRIASKHADDERETLLGFAPYTPNK